MKNTKTTPRKVSKDLTDTNANYNPTARDFQRTPNDVDNISRSEKQAKRPQDHKNAGRKSH